MARTPKPTANSTTTAIVIKTYFIHHLDFPQASILLGSDLFVSIAMVVGCLAECQGFTVANDNITLVWLGEAPKAEADLKRIDTGIRRNQSGVGDVHEAKFDTPVVFAAQKMRADRAARSEVYVRGAGRRLLIREKGAASEVDIGHHIVARNKIPLEGERVEAEAVSGAGALDYEEHGDNVDRVFEPSFEQARAGRIGENPAVSQSDVPNSGAGVAAVEPVAAASPDLQFLAVVGRW